MGAIFSTPLVIVTSGSLPSVARASIAVSRSSSRARRAAMNCSKSASTATGRVPACCSSCRVFGGDQAFLEGSVLPAAGHPDIAGAQSIAQLRQHAEFVIAPVDGAAGQDMGRPALPDEPGRCGFRQGRIFRAVRLAQHLDRAHERGGCWHALELERLEKGRRPTPDAGVVLAEVLVSVEFLRPRQGLRFGDSRAKLLPRHQCDDRVVGILLVVTGGDQRSADARVETDFLIDGPSIGLEGAGMPPLGLAEHGADQPVEQIDGLVGQAGGEVQADRHQRRVPSLPFIVGDMLDRGAAGLAGELCQARLMDEMSTAWFDADTSYMSPAARSDRAWP